MNIVYLGSPEQAIAPLKFLLENEKHNDYKVVGVVSQPAKPVGRGRKANLQDPPVAKFAKEAGLRCLQPEKAKNQEFIAEFRALEPDIALTCAYGQILSAEFLQVPKRATINIHPSRLPNYRGAIPIPAALLDGLSHTSVTILFTVKKLDAGAIIVQKEFAIEPTETAVELTKRLFAASGPLVLQALIKLQDPLFKGIEQVEDQVSHCKKIEKNDGLIDWKNMPSKKLVNRYRAFAIWPGVFTFLNSKRIVLENIYHIQNEDFSLAAGQFVYSKHFKALIVGCAQNEVIAVGKLKPEGGKLIDAASFYNGLKDKSCLAFDVEER